MTRIACLGCFRQAAFLKRFHSWAKAAWFVGTVVICATPLRNSVPLLSFMSGYAIVMGHWSSEQGVRAEQAARSNARDQDE